MEKLCKNFDKFCEKCTTVLNKHLKELMNTSGVLSVAVGKKKLDDGTQFPVIAVYVKKKLPLKTMRKSCPNDIIPSEIDGVKTNVVELSPDDFEIGKTSMSDITPERRRILEHAITK